MDLLGIRRGSFTAVGVRDLLWVVMALAMSATLTTSARAEGCSVLTEQVRTRQRYAPVLPDCRAYEQVSPVEKGLANVWGGNQWAQAAPSGAEMIYFSDVAFPGAPGSKGEVSTYLGARSRGGEEWLTSGLLPFEASTAQVQDKVTAITEDLADTILTTGGGPALAPGAVVGEHIVNAYVKDNVTDSYQLLATDIGNSPFGFADATPGGSRVLFETSAKLTPEAQFGVINLYEWNEAKPLPQRLSLVGVLPNGETPKEGSVAGAGGPSLTETGGKGGSAGEYYTQHTISKDGSRVFFSDSETGRIYMREPDAEPAVTIPVSKGQAFWRAATPDGSYVIYTEGSELYRFNAEKDQEELLTNGAEGVLGTFGLSDDGAYVYFVAPGELASNENGNGEKAEKGAANLYEWHEDATIFIAKQVEGADWAARFRKVETVNSSAGGEKSSRVTPDGKAILFASPSPVTSYNSNGQIELYRYTAGQPLSTGNPVCVSCSPENRAAVGNAQLTALLPEDATSDRPSSRNTFVTHNLSSDGDRVFFETKDGLVPGDINGQADVYEWEREGGGSCVRSSPAFHEGDGGCLYLISTGRSDGTSYFGDASADGSNVFFFTAQSLVGQDLDDLADVYDARVEGGVSSQNPPAPAVACEGETCRVASGVPPLLGVPSSTTLSGAGNLSPSVSVIAPKLKTPAQIAAERRVKALKACKHKSKAKRRRCEAAVRKRYGSKPKAKRAAQRGGRHS
jgi:hypothetical protein